MSTHDAYDDHDDDGEPVDVPLNLLDDLDRSSYGRLLAIAEDLRRWHDENERTPETTAYETAIMSRLADAEPVVPERILDQLRGVDRATLDHLILRWTDSIQPTDRAIARAARRELADRNERMFDAWDRAMAQGDGEQRGELIGTEDDFAEYLERLPLL